MSRTILPDTDHRAMGRIARTVERLTLDTPASYAIAGPRTDLASGWGTRVRIGLLADGVTYGVERYLEDGTHQTPTWA